MKNTFRAETQRAQREDNLNFLSSAFSAFSASLRETFFGGGTHG
jgi:hypothetical protein